MRARTAAAAGVGLICLLVQGCGGPADLPDSPTFQECLRSAGVDPDNLDDESRREALADPAALDCVAGELDAGERRDALAEVFTTEQLADALLAWARESDAGAEVRARDAGALLGAGGDEEDRRVAGGQLDENLAWEIYRDVHGEPPSHQRWLDDDEAQLSVSEDDPYAPASGYLDWLEDHGADSREYALAQEIRDLQVLVADARTAGADVS